MVNFILRYILTYIISCGNYYFFYHRFADLRWSDPDDSVKTNVMETLRNSRIGCTGKPIVSRTGNRSHLHADGGSLLRKFGNGLHYFDFFAWPVNPKGPLRGVSPILTLSLGYLLRRWVKKKVPLDEKDEKTSSI